MKLRTNDPWMPAPEYGRALKGLTINLLVSDIAGALRFQTGVLSAEIVYSDPDFAVVSGYGSQWMFHADHTYDAHPFAVHTRGGPAGGRGRGIELRLHGCDPDRAESAARQLGYSIVSPASDKPHGLRELFVCDTDGYVWVPDVPLEGAD